MLTDPVADYLTPIRNAIGSGHDEVAIPASGLKVEMSRILKEQGYIRDFARTGPIRWGAGGLASYLKPDPITVFFYGDRPEAYMLFLQARF